MASVLAFQFVRVSKRGDTGLPPLLVCREDGRLPTPAPPTPTWLMTEGGRTAWSEEDGLGPALYSSGLLLRLGPRGRAWGIIAGISPRELAEPPVEGLDVLMSLADPDDPSLEFPGRECEYEDAKLGSGDALLGVKAGYNKGAPD